MVPKVDFYILDAANEQQALLFVCQLLEKAYMNNERASVHLPSPEKTQQLDALLWTFKDISFIPHTVNETVIEIGQGKQEILFNLTPEIPTEFRDFLTIVEVVYPDAHIQQLARTRFRNYREQGCELNTHKIKNH